MEEFTLKLTGKANIPKALALGNAYRIILDGEVTKEEKQSNHDGSNNVIFTYKPIIAQIETEHEVLKTKDLRNNSVKFQKACWKVWADSNLEGESDSFYDFATGRAISLLNQIAQDYRNK